MVLEKNLDSRNTGWKDCTLLLTQNISLPFAFVRRYLWIFTMEYVAEISCCPWLGALYL